MSPSPESTPRQIPLVVVTGPTAAGKTQLALRLAEHFGGEVVNADSMQVFRYMDIGTAKPSIEERGRVPHHLFDIVTPDVDYSAGRYAEDARIAIDAIRHRGKVPMLVGGTGLYIRALIHGLVPTGGADARLRERLEREAREAEAAGELQYLHRRLRDLDPAAAEAIHPNDSRRTIRALEIIEQSGRPASEVRGEHGFDQASFEALHLVIDPGREVVSARIEARCHAMIEAGLLREVRGLRGRGYGPELRAMRGIGYRHLNPVADGVDTLANAVVSMAADTRRFARRQRTWLRKVDAAEWFDPGAEVAIFDRVGGFLAAGGG